MLKIKCIENSYNGQITYSGFISYKELSEYAFLKPLTVNRVTDNSRIAEMTGYIEEGRNYPPIVVAIEEGNKIEYSNYELRIKSDKPVLVIIDGQHRYLSIKELLEKNNSDRFEERKQAIYIMSGLTEFEQRKCFIDINDTMKRVSKISKRIFESTEQNYLTLKTIIDLNIISNINIKNDQCTKKYPYKFILQGNELIFENIDIEKEDNYIEELDKYSRKSVVIWREILEFIDKYTNLSIISNTGNSKNYKSVKTEIFILEVIKKLITMYDSFNSILEVEDLILKQEVKNFMDNIVSVYNYFDFEEEINSLNKVEKSKKISEIFSKGER